MDTLTIDTLNDNELKQLIEAGIFVRDKPTSVQVLKDTVLGNMTLSNAQVQETIKSLQQDYQDKGVQLVRVAGGYQFQTRANLSPYLQKLQPQKPQKYSRATLETLAVIIYRQPVTRGEIEAVRGVSIGSHIIKSLLDRSWIKVVGHKEVPGRPALYGTTSTLLAYFGLTSIGEFPPLSDPQSLQALLTNSASKQIEESTNE